MEQLQIKFFPNGISVYNCPSCNKRIVNHEFMLHHFNYPGTPYEEVLLEIFCGYCYEKNIVSEKDGKFYINEKI
jgi:hypothetical protein